MNFTEQRVPDSHTSIDEELVRVIMSEVADYLNDIDQINETSIKRIASIAWRHLNGHPIGKPQTNLNKYLIMHDEFLRQLNSFDRRNLDTFMERLEQYLITTLLNTSNVCPVAVTNTTNTTTSTQNMSEDDFFYTNSTSDVMINNGLRKKDDNVPLVQTQSNINTNSITLADVVAVIGGGHMPIDVDNEDLAEADQVCSSDDVYSTEDDFNSRTDGAIGGVSSTLPDLAKVNATATNNQLDVSMIGYYYL